MKMWSRGLSESRARKKCRKWFGFGLDLLWIWILFGYISRHLWRCFLMCFLDASFSIPVHHLDARGSTNDVKLMPKVKKRMSWNHLVECVKSIAGTAQEPHGELPRWAQESLFSGLISRRRSGEVWIRFCSDITNFRAPFRKPLEWLLGNKIHFFLDLEKLCLGHMLLEGPAVGARSLWVFRFCRIASSSVTPCTLKGVGES